MIPIQWVRLVELARQVDEHYRQRGAVDTDAAMRLVNGVVTFQEQLLGNSVRTMRRPP
jgi:hypothetical protein